MNTKNTEYLKDTGCPEEAIQTCLDAMKKYGDNCWWFSENSDDRAYFQLSEPILLLKMHDFHVDLEKLLGRPVQTIEFAYNCDGLKQEAETARKNKNSEKTAELENGYFTFYRDFEEKNSVS